MAHLAPWDVASWYEQVTELATIMAGLAAAESTGSEGAANQLRAARDLTLAWLDADERGYPGERDKFIREESRVRP